MTPSNHPRRYYFDPEIQTDKENIKTYGSVDAGQFWHGGRYFGCLASIFLLLLPLIVVVNGLFFIIAPTGAFDAALGFDITVENLIDLTAIVVLIGMLIAFLRNGMYDRWSQVVALVMVVAVLAVGTAAQALAEQTPPCIMGLLFLLMALNVFLLGGTLHKFLKTLHKFSKDVDQDVTVNRVLIDITITVVSFLFLFVVDTDIPLFVDSTVNEVLSVSLTLAIFAFTPLLPFKLWVHIKSIQEGIEGADNNGTKSGGSKDEAELTETFRKVKESEVDGYLVMVPVFKDPQAMPRLIKNLSLLQYPEEKLNVMLLVEQSEDEQVANKWLSSRQGTAKPSSSTPRQFRFAIPNLEQMYTAVRRWLAVVFYVLLPIRIFQWLQTMSMHRLFGDPKRFLPNHQPHKSADSIPVTTQTEAIKEIVSILCNADLPIQQQKIGIERFVIVNVPKRQLVPELRKMEAQTKPRALNYGLYHNFEAKDCVRFKVTEYCPSDLNLLFCWTKRINEQIIKFLKGDTIEDIKDIQRVECRPIASLLATIFGCCYQNHLDTIGKYLTTQLNPTIPNGDEVLSNLLFMTTIHEAIKCACENHQKSTTNRVTVILPIRRPYKADSEKISYCVVYDAEDRPEEDQLLKSVRRFYEMEEDKDKLEEMVRDHRNKQSILKCREHLAELAKELDDKEKQNGNCEAKKKFRDAQKNFRKQQPLVCFQAKLVYENLDDNWVISLFKAEYSAWFYYFLPGLFKYNLPIPLGGTSNHFYLPFLYQIGGWDSYNVAEDCDLGMWIARHGKRVQILESITWEIANPDIFAWVKQRSRWIKGYMQTFFVHMRNPKQLYSDFSQYGKGGWVRFASFLLTVGGGFLLPMIVPIFLITTLTYMVSLLGLVVTSFFTGSPFFVFFQEPIQYIYGIHYHWVLPLGTGSFFISNFIYFIIFVVGYLRHPKPGQGIWIILWWWLYSIFLVIAAFRALWEYLFKPYSWALSSHSYLARLR